MDSAFSPPRIRISGSERSLAVRRRSSCLRSLQLEMHAQPLLAWQPKCPILCVAVRVNEADVEMLQVCRLGATGNVEKGELDSLVIWRFACDQARPVACFTVVDECQALTFQIDHRGLR